MAKVDHENLGGLLEAQTRLWKDMSIAVKTASLRCAVGLGIIDAMHKHGKPMSLPELTSALPIKPYKSPHLYRLMRFLTNAGFFAVEKEGYVLTPDSRILLKDGPLSMRSLFLLALDPITAKSLDFMPEWFQNDDNCPFETAQGINYWEFNAGDARFRQLFNEAMACDSELMTEMLITDCKHIFEGLTSLVDVGGGTGTVAKAIATSFPSIKCTVLDLPHVVANQDQGAHNLEFVAGDMFENIPSANAILLKWILHDWSDEECVKILKKCRNAIPKKDEGGKIIIIEVVIDKHEEDKDSLATKLTHDIQVMALFNSKERDKDEWETIFRAAGLSDYIFFPVLGMRCIIELYP